MFSFIFKKINGIKGQLGETFAFFSQLIEAKMTIDDGIKITNEMIDRTNEFMDEIEPNLNRVNRRFKMMKNEIDSLKKK